MAAVGLIIQTGLTAVKTVFDISKSISDLIKHPKIDATAVSTHSISFCNTQPMPSGVCRRLKMRLGS
jgi:hypothetical protein